MGEVIAFVEKRRLQGLSAGIGEAIAEVEIGDMTYDFPEGSTCIERKSPDFRRDGHLFRSNILNECVDSPLRLSQSSGDAFVFDAFCRARATEASNFTSGETKNGLSTSVSRFSSSS
jgi:hypothetical protein